MYDQSAARANTHATARLVSSSLSSQYPTYLNGTTTSFCQVLAAAVHRAVTGLLASPRQGVGTRYPPKPPDPTDPLGHELHISPLLV